MTINEIVEIIVREEVHREFDIPIICPPNNRVSSEICKRIISALKEKVSVEVIAKCIYDYGIKMNAEGYESNIELTILENAKDLAQEIHKLITKELTGEGEGNG